MLSLYFGRQIEHWGLWCCSGWGCAQRSTTPPRTALGVMQRSLPKVGLILDRDISYVTYVYDLGMMNFGVSPFTFLFSRKSDMLC